MKASPEGYLAANAALANERALELVESTHHRQDQLAMGLISSMAARSSLIKETSGYPQGGDTQQGRSDFCVGDERRLSVQRTDLAIEPSKNLGQRGAIGRLRFELSDDVPALP